MTDSMVTSGSSCSTLPAWSVMARFSLDTQFQWISCSRLRSNAAEALAKRSAASRAGGAEGDGVTSAKMTETQSGVRIPIRLDYTADGGVELLSGLHRFFSHVSLNGRYQRITLARNGHRSWRHRATSINSS